MYLAVCRFRLCCITRENSSPLSSFHLPLLSSPLELCLLVFSLWRVLDNFPRQKIFSFPSRSAAGILLSAKAKRARKMESKRRRRERERKWKRKEKEKEDREVKIPLCNRCGEETWKSSTPKTSIEFEGTIDHFTRDTRSGGTQSAGPIEIVRLAGNTWMHGLPVCLLTWYIKHRLDWLSYRSLNASYRRRARRKIPGNLCKISNL